MLNRVKLTAWKLILTLMVTLLLMSHFVTFYHLKVLKQLEFSTSCLGDPVLETLLKASGSNVTASDVMVAKVETYVTLSSPVHARSAFSDVCAAAICGNFKEKPGAECFEEILPDELKMRVYSAMHSVQRNFTDRGLEFQLAEGSLLGSQRHFGIIPWDDDVDVMIRVDEKPQVRLLLEQLSMQEQYEFRDTEKSLNHWKLGILCSWSGKTRAKECAIQLDLFFISIGKYTCTRTEPPYLLQTSLVLPVILRPFGPYLMRAPRRTHQFLSRAFGADYADKCIFRSHAGTYGKCENRNDGCNQLRGRYPFVSRVVARVQQRLIKLELLTRGCQILAVFVPR